MNLNLFRILLTVLLFQVPPAFAQHPLGPLPAATDSAYGYTAEKPLQMKRRDWQKSSVYTRTFLSGLFTADGQKLQLAERVSLENPNTKKGIFKNRFTGLPLNGNLGILDRYIFRTAGSGDTVVLFVDLYKKGVLQVPVGLKYEEAEN